MNALLVIWVLFVFLHFIFLKKVTGDINILRDFIYDIRYLKKILGDTRHLTPSAETPLGIYELSTYSVSSYLFFSDFCCCAYRFL